ncbi:MAG: dipeptidyl aminopeptidase [Gammaproteobacteria bacterium]|nr:MAG: dipeptidyl aminopeptidase [Gammaproteobacteria bacterium]
MVLVPLGIHLLLLWSLAPSRVAHEHSPPEHGVPESAVEELWLESVNRKRVFAWFIAADAGQTNPASPRPATLIMHGWGSNAAMMLAMAAPLRAAGQAALFIDARSHGRSDGEAFSSMPRFAEDIATGLAWLRTRPGIDGERLSLIGHSVGAAATLLHASRHHDVCAVISLSAFAHPREVMQRWIRSQRLPLECVANLVLRHVERVIGERFDDIAPVSTAARLKCPLLVVHGRQDDTVPFDDARRIVAAAPCSRLLAIDGDHDLRRTLPPHVDELIGFLRRSCHDAGAA